MHNAIKHVLEKIEGEHQIMTTEKKKEWYDDPEYIEKICTGLFPSSRWFNNFK